MKPYRITTTLYVEANSETDALTYFLDNMPPLNIEVNTQYTTVDDPNCCNQGCGCHDG